MPQVRVHDQTSAVQQKQTAQETFSRFVVPLLAILATAAMLYIVFATCWEKFSRAEIFFAESAREMIVYNNMITPLFHTKPFFDKPILVYWLIVSSYKAFGITHLVARIPSIVAALVTIALTACATRHLAQNKRDIAGLIAAMCTASGFMFFSFAYLCMSDMFLVMFDTITLMLLYAGVQNERRRTLLWLLGAASMGFAFITKGPIGIVLPAISFLAYLGITKRLATIKWYHVAFGAIIAVAIAMPWFYAAYQANGSWALAYFFIRENFERYAASTYDTHKPVWFMLVCLFTGFLPWSVFIPDACKDFVSNARKSLTSPETQKKLFLWLWVAVVVGFFSFSRGKCDYYVLPAFPAAAALVALYLTEQTRRSPRILATILSGAFLAVGCLSPFILSVFSIGNGFSAWWMMPTALVAFGAMGLSAATNNRLSASIACLFLGICFGAAGFSYQMSPALLQARPLDVYAEKMKATAPYTRVGVHRELGNGHWLEELTFQVERDPIELTDTKTIRDFFAGGPGMALIPEESFKKALSESGDLRSMPLSVIDRRMVAAKALTPGYVIKRKGNLTDTMLLLVSN